MILDLMTKAIEARFGSVEAIEINCEAQVFDGVQSVEEDGAVIIADKSDEAREIKARQKAKRIKKSKGRCRFLDHELAYDFPSDKSPKSLEAGRV
jgi:hypothetical protein